METLIAVDDIETFGPFPIDESVVGVDVAIPGWLDRRQEVGIDVELSFDGGVNWRISGSYGPQAGGPISPRSPTRGITVLVLEQRCWCGSPYLPGDPKFDRCRQHSTIKLRIPYSRFRKMLPVDRRAWSPWDFKLTNFIDRRGYDIDETVFERTYHKPSPAEPARRDVRVRVSASRPLMTSMTVTAV